MTKFLSSLFALAMVAGLAVAPASADPGHGMAMGHRKCERGSHWVPAHRDRMGRWVRAHCAPNR